MTNAASLDAVDYLSLHNQLQFSQSASLPENLARLQHSSRSIIFRSRPLHWRLEILLMAAHLLSPPWLPGRSLRLSTDSTGQAVESPSTLVVLDQTVARTCSSATMKHDKAFLQSATWTKQRACKNGQCFTKLQWPAMLSYLCADSSRSCIDHQDVVILKKHAPPERTSFASGTLYSHRTPLSKFLRFSDDALRTVSELSRGHIALMVPSMWLLFNEHLHACQRRNSVTPPQTSIVQPPRPLQSNFLWSTLPPHHNYLVMSFWPAHLWKQSSNPSGCPMSSSSRDRFLWSQLPLHPQVLNHQMLHTTCCSAPPPSTPCCLKRALHEEHLDPFR